MLPVIKNMSNTYNSVIITKYNDRKTRYTCEDVNGYLSYIKCHPDMVEVIGEYGQQIKPIFDIDAYDNDINIGDVRNKINTIFPNKIVNWATREPRNTEKGMKYSYRFYIQDVRITSKNLKQLLIENGFDKNPIYDMSIYDKNKVLFLPLTTKKVGIDVPPLKPYNCDIFNCCASYIKKEYEDWDLKIPVVEEPKKLEVKFNDELYDNTEITYDGTLNFNEIMTKLSKDRATNYNDWFYIIVALINLFYRKIITRGQIYDLADLFSSKSDNYDADGVSKVIDTNISRFNGKGYGIKYFLECLKVDDIEYYKKITKKDMIINGANDDIGASEIVVNHYRDLFVICKGILYVKNENIWCYNEKQVDKLLIDMIGSLDVMFYGADGKRLYNYNKSIKHIKDCIVCIKANKTIINDKFYNDMIKNNKYYLPFNDGIYSFKDKKLYNYKDLSNIHFTFKINRNFPKFNQKDYDELMDRVIIPIYPIQEERKFNAHIKSRALAGCYEDKKWYGYSGSRNSGKSCETGILRSSFGDFVLEFNAKCLILSKFINPDCAKALSWVVDKKDARIIISNEIDGDENTVLNGAFIKTLASGGDSMEGRKNYQDEVSFIPQFTMILCYNHLYEIKPADAKENLEQFEYKSKFVSQDELVDGIPYLKLKDDTIKSFIKEERIIDAYTLYILNAFTETRMNIPESIKNSTEINNGEEQISVEQFIIKNFINSNDSKDRLHTESISGILNDNGYKINPVETGKLMNRIGIGKYNKNCNIDKCRKAGYDYIKCIGRNDEV